MSDLENKKIEVEERIVHDSEDQFAAQSAQPMMKIILSQFFKHKAAVISSFIILFFLLIALFAPLISKLLKIDPNLPEYNRMNRSSTPKKQIQSIIDDDLLYNFIQTHKKRSKDIIQEINTLKLLTKQELEEAKGDDEEILIILLKKMEDKKFLEKIRAIGIKEIVQMIEPQQANQVIHFLGTDKSGRDILMRLIYGTRISITVGLLVATFSGLIGLIIGSLAGYYGGFIDSLLMRITDSLLSLPLIPILIIFAAVDLNKVPFLGQYAGGQNESVIKMIIILCLFSWMTVARLVRGCVLTIKEREFVLAAKTIGASDLRIIAVHMVPNVIAPLLISVTLGVGNAILFESALSFLGLGIQPPMPSWGNMLNDAQMLIHESISHAIYPGVLIFIVVICFNFVGDGLQSALDPKSLRR